MGRRGAGTILAADFDLGFAMFQSLRTSVLFALIALPFFATAATAESASTDVGRKSSVAREGAEIQHFCTEMEEVQFLGNNNRIETFGPCHSISVQGSGNTVDVQSLATQIAVNGDGNTVTWPPADRPKPVTKVSGKGNIVEQQKVN